jgi:dihydropyrimidinase
MNFDTIVTGGKVVTPSGVVETDIGIRDEKIAALGQDLAAEKNGATVVDASGHLVLPGVIDVHVHLELPFCGTISSDDYRSGTRAGARGGVTTLMD